MALTVWLLLKLFVTNNKMLQGILLHKQLLNSDPFYPSDFPYLELS